MLTRRNAIGGYAVILSVVIAVQTVAVGAQEGGGVDEPMCRREARDEWRQCKKECPRGPGMRTCVQGCWARYAVGLQDCANAAADLRWVRTGGPPGGLGYDIRYNFDDFNTWYVTDNFAGVHVSRDNGVTWQPSRQGIARQGGPAGDWMPIFSLTVDPIDPQIVWAGTDKTGHIYKSMDGGNTWVQKDNGVVRQTDAYDALTFRGFTVDPKDSDTVYAMGEIANTLEGGANVWSTATGGVVYKTVDGGENWSLSWDGGIPSSLARYMFIDPDDTDILYVSTGIFDRGAVNEKDPLTAPVPWGGLGVLKSTDGGRSWNALDEDNGLDFLYVGSLFMHPDDPAILLAAAGKPETELYAAYRDANNLPDPTGVYRTENGGDLWRQVLVGDSPTVVEMCPSDPEIAYAASGGSVHRSDDGGQTWTQVAGENGRWGPPGVKAGTPIDFQCDPRNPDRVFANNYLGGAFLSEDGGKTWSNASDGYTGAQIVSAAIDPENPSQIYVGGRTGIWGSRDGGSSWHGLRYPPAGMGADDNEFGGVAIDPSAPHHLLCNTGTSIWESFDGGSNWELRQRPVNVRSHGPIVFAPSDPSIVYTGVADTLCLVSQESPCTLGQGVFVSRNGGTTWDFANDTNIAGQPVIDLAVDPSDAHLVYVATEIGLFKTADGGTSWTLFSSLPAATRVGAIAINPKKSKDLLAGVEGHGLFATMDGGEHWEMVTAGLPPNSSIRDIQFDPMQPRTIYLSDLLSGVYRSVDGGRLWTRIIQGLTNRSATGLSISSDGHHVYVATNGEGVFRLDLTGEPPS